MPIALSVRSAASATLAIAVLLLVTAALPPSAGGQDICEPGDAGGCLPLPPCRVLPQPARPPDLDSPVMSDAASRLCAAQEAVAAVNLANDRYVRAVSTLDTTALGEAWADAALAEISAQVTLLQAFGRIATPRLLEASLIDVEASDERARIRTRERWLYQERDRDTQDVLAERDAWWDNDYTLARRDGRWLVIANAVNEVSGVRYQASGDDSRFP